MTTILFDLDGTLIDTTALVIPAMRRAVKHYSDLPEPDEQTIRDTFGRPDEEIWARLLPGSPADIRRQAFEMSERIVVEGIRNTDVLLPHAKEVLAELKQRGHVLTIASNCGVPYLEAILSSQGIGHLFDAPLCLGSVQGARKADILAAHFRHFRRDDSVMVGDRSSDVEAANAHGIPTVGCNFGFGDARELAGAIAIVSSLPELLTLFLPHGRWKFADGVHQ